MPRSRPLPHPRVDAATTSPQMLPLLSPPTTSLVRSRHGRSSVGLLGGLGLLAGKEILGGGPSSLWFSGAPPLFLHQWQLLHACSLQMVHFQAHGLLRELGSPLCFGWNLKLVFTFILNRIGISVFQLLLSMLGFLLMCTSISGEMGVRTGSGNANTGLGR